MKGIFNQMNIFRAKQTNKRLKLKNYIHLFNIRKKEKEFWLTL